MPQDRKQSWGIGRGGITILNACVMHDRFVTIFEAPKEFMPNGGTVVFPPKPARSAAMLCALNGLI